MVDPSREGFAEPLAGAPGERAMDGRTSGAAFCRDILGCASSSSRARNPGDGDVPASAVLVRYRRRVDAAKVLEIVAAMEAAT